VRVPKLIHWTRGAQLQGIDVEVMFECFHDKESAVLHQRIGTVGACKGSPINGQGQKTLSSQLLHDLAASGLDLFRIAQHNFFLEM
jgi:hypothetical protein